MIMYTHTEIFNTTDMEKVKVKIYKGELALIYDGFTNYKVYVS